jgi:hypothetical protein
MRLSTALSHIPPTRPLFWLDAPVAAAAFCLSELSTDQERRAAVEALWVRTHIIP